MALCALCLPVVAAIFLTSTANGAVSRERRILVHPQMCHWLNLSTAQCRHFRKYLGIKFKEPFKAAQLEETVQAFTPGYHVH
jgi:hypothetical protein